MRKIFLTVVIFATLFVVAAFGAVAIVRLAGMPERHGALIMAALICVLYAAAWRAIWSTAITGRRRLLAFGASMSAGLGVLAGGELVVWLLLALLDKPAIEARAVVVSSRLLVGLAAAAAALRVSRRILAARAGI